MISVIAYVTRRGASITVQGLKLEPLQRFEESRHGCPCFRRLPTRLDRECGAANGRDEGSPALPQQPTTSGGFPSSPTSPNRPSPASRRSVKPAFRNVTRRRQETAVAMIRADGDFRSLGPPDDWPRRCLLRSRAAFQRPLHLRQCSRGRVVRGRRRRAPCSESAPVRPYERPSFSRAQFGWRSLIRRPGSPREQRTARSSTPAFGNVTRTGAERRLLPLPWVKCPMRCRQR